jgi:CspA family cold shock protein
MSVRKSGVIKFYNEKKGFGFIRFDVDRDVFFHVSELESRHTLLNEGDAVTFETGQGQKGPVAVKVRLE